MNLLFLDDVDFVSVDRVVLHNRRLKYLHEVRRVKSGGTLRADRLGGWVGEGCLLKLDVSEATLEVRFDQLPPAKLPITLLLALPRPKMFRRMLQIVAAMGVPGLVLLNSYRVEESFWQTPLLDLAAIRGNLVLGLEQACDMMLPEVIAEKRFKPFVEDRLLAPAAGSLGLVGHPGPWPARPRAMEKPVTLAIDPEGGQIPYEAGKLREAGLHSVQLGERILHVETAISVLPTRLLRENSGKRLKAFPA